MESKKYNIGEMFKDSENNLFVITEIHSGFVWLRNTKGDLKQIDREQLKYYKEVKNGIEM